MLGLLLIRERSLPRAKVSIWGRGSLKMDNWRTTGRGWVTEVSEQRGEGT